VHEGWGIVVKGAPVNLVGVTLMGTCGFGGGLALDNGGATTVVMKVYDCTIASNQAEKSGEACTRFEQSGYEYNRISGM